MFGKDEDDEPDQRSNIFGKKPSAPKPDFVLHAGHPNPRARNLTGGAFCLVFDPYPPWTVIAGQVLFRARSMVVAEAGGKWRTAFVEAAVPLFIVLTQFSRLGRTARSVVSADIDCAAMLADEHA
jgi:hypothetical protein